jgi:CelD/BcsL family acetyltransferase involved in cellulose biosynthesis
MLMRQDARPAASRIHIVPASKADADAVAARAHPKHAFLRSAWADAAAPAGVQRWAAVRGDGNPFCVLPLVTRKIGPLKVREVAGCYWPFRSVAVAADAQPAELSAMFGASEMKRALGPAWRLGPVFEDDPAAVQLRKAAESAGWAVLTRRLGTCFDIDVAALQAEGPWPRGSTMRKNRWREKQLAESGAVEFRTFSGANWTAAERDAIAEIERKSWLASLGDAAAFQFADAQRRRFWEQVSADPVIGSMIFGATLSIGDVPAAFSFGLQVGSTRYQIANNFDQRFAAASPGKVLLYKHFSQAADCAIERISWGSGDSGYKTDMGARAGPAILDLLFIRARGLAPLIQTIWRDAKD